MTDTAVVTGIVGIVGAIAGAIAGSVLSYVLTERGAKNREARTDAKIRESVRTLITLEVGHNLSELKGYWSRVADSPEDLEAPRVAADRGDRMVARRQANHVALNPLPVWRTSAWSGLTASITPALTVDEIRATAGLYADLDELTAIRAALLDAKSELPRQEMVDFGTRITPMTIDPQRFDNEAPSLWFRFALISTRRISAGTTIATQMY